MNAIVNNTAAATAVPLSQIIDPYSVDVSKGALNGTVSRQWSVRSADECFDDLDALYSFKKDVFDRSQQGWCHSNDFEFFAPEVKEVGDYRRLNLGINKMKTPGGDLVRSFEVEPTHWSFGQLCERAGMPRQYFRKVPGGLAADHLNWNLKYVQDAEQVGLYLDDTSIHAATSVSYGRIPDHKVVEAVQRIAGKGTGDMHWKTPGKINWSNMTYDPENIGEGRDRTFYGSDRDMFIFLVDDRRPIVVGKTKDGKDDHMFRGFYIQNSEVGSRSMKISSFYLRGVCMNRNLWGCEGFQEITIRHTRIAPDRWLEQVVPALESFSAASDSLLIDSVNKAKEKKLADRDEDAISFLRNRSFSAAAVTAIVDIHEHEEGKPMRSAWDFAQGITAYARSAINTDTRLGIEMVAKKILDDVVHVAPLEVEIVD